jgi:hypothetical protein
VPSDAPAERSDPGYVWELVDPDGNRVGEPNPSLDREGLARPEPAQGSPIPNTVAGTGRISVDVVRGWCAVKIDNVEIGPSPIADHQLPAGQHVVACTPEGATTKKETIWLAAGETRRVRFGL